MDVSDYRKKYEAGLRKVGSKTIDFAAVAEAISDKGANADQRAAVIESVPIDPKGIGGMVERLLSVVRDRAEPKTVREAALRALGAASFLGPRFAPHRADYLQALRELAEDPEPGLRESALEALAIEKDPFAQELLLKVVKGDIDLVPLAKAIQLLAYDIHSEIIPAIRDVLKRATGAAKEEALRVLAIDPESEGLFRRLLKDKSQPSIIRRLSASGLQAINPDAFQKAAREIVSDGKEFKEIIATTLSALAHAQEVGKSAADSALVKHVENLKERTSSSNVKAAIKRFLQSTHK
ncbi:MAG: hypothetical protein QOC56_1451 [Alphaproteobacteria bacterium]|jgi:uncharacterized protein (UPF0147 family)|nr:hypothetical protein [Alphaproteobacteria bacterium]